MPDKNQPEEIEEQIEFGGSWEKLTLIALTFAGEDNIYVNAKISDKEDSASLIRKSFSALVQVLLEHVFFVSKRDVDEIGVYGVEAFMNDALEKAFDIAMNSLVENSEEIERETNELLN